MPSPVSTGHVQALLQELSTPLTLSLYQSDDPARVGIEDFIRRIFRVTHGAQVDAFYPQLLGFQAGASLEAVVGLRGGDSDALFCQRYFDRPLAEQISGELGQRVEGRQLVEVGNLALSHSGQARWVIAMVTAWLYHQGFEWVLFTAVRPLYNAFHRMGLEPVILGEADPARLPDQGRSWGRYYQQQPLVCVGNIATGYRALRASITPRQPNLCHLWRQAESVGRGCTECGAQGR